MNLIKKNWLFIVLLLVLVLVYFLIRLPNLSNQPIFADEAIYVRWAQVMRAEATLRFLPLSDGKTPLFMWIMIPFFKVFHDPLLAGRFLSVLSGFGSLLAIASIGRYFFSKRIALVASFIYVITPMFFFFDRMALVDSMLAAFSLWALFGAMLLIKFPRIDLAMVLGYLIGAGMLTKPPGFFSIVTLPTTFLLFNWRSQSRQSKLLRQIGLFVITLIITLGIYNILRLGPGFSNLSNRNSDYVFAINELYGRLLDPLIPHFNDLVDWFPKILTIPVLVLMIAGIFFALFKKNKPAIVVLLWGAVPLLIEMMFLRTFTARYILFCTLPFVILAGYGLEQIINLLKFNQKILWIIALAILIPQAAFFDYYLIVDPAKAPLPNEERKGYLEDWTAGYGLKDIATYLDNESKISAVVVGTEGAFGTLPDGLQIYLDKNRQVTVIGGSNYVSNQLKNASLNNSTFYVANKSRFMYVPDNLTLIKEYPKAIGKDLPQDAILLFKVNPISSSSAKLNLNEKR